MIKDIKLTTLFISLVMIGFGMLFLTTFGIGHFILLFINETKTLSNVMLYGFSTYSLIVLSIMIFLGSL